MHKYLIDLMRYTEDGEPTNEHTYDFADTPQGLADKVSKWNKMRYATKNPETGEVIVGNKMYKVTPMQGRYQPIDDFESFVAINAVQYHG